MAKLIHDQGKRKKAIARATLGTGKGRIRINGMDLHNFSSEIMRLRVSEPLILAGDIAKGIDINISVRGGGVNGQADACRLAIARALTQHQNSLRKVFMDYDRLLLVADKRQNETSKPNDSKPRAKRQKSYR